jgi:hypothetical protein
MTIGSETDLTWIEVVDRHGTGAADEGACLGTHQPRSAQGEG